MNRLAWILSAALTLPAAVPVPGTPAQAASLPAIRHLDPPEQGFYSKVLDYHGILIKAHRDVSDEALRIAYDHLELQLKHLPVAAANLAAARAELHIIGRNQVTTDLPEWKVDKHVPLDEYNGLTRDQRTRGMGGLITSCGEENLLRLPKDQDRYFGRDICLHEFAHDIHGVGLDDSLRKRIHDLSEKSKAKGLWLHSYAGSNEFEYFAELTMWYFGTHGDLTMTGPKPENGPEGLRKYDPEAYAFFDDLYQGRIPVAPSRHEAEPDDEPGWVPHDSEQARSLVAKLTAYRIGTTTLAAFQGDAGLKAPGDEGREGWHIKPLEPAGTFQVSYRDPKGKDHSIADLAFKAGILTAFHWNN